MMHNLLDCCENRWSTIFKKKKTKKLSCETYAIKKNKYQTPKWPITKRPACGDFNHPKIICINTTDAIKSSCFDIK